MSEDTVAVLTDPSVLTEIHSTLAPVQDAQYEAELRAFVSNLPVPTETQADAFTGSISAAQGLPDDATVKAFNEGGLFEPQDVPYVTHLPGEDPKKTYTVNFVPPPPPTLDPDDPLVKKFLEEHTTVVTADQLSGFESVQVEKKDTEPKTVGGEHESNYKGSPVKDDCSGFKMGYDEKVKRESTRTYPISALDPRWQRVAELSIEINTLLVQILTDK